MSNMLPADLTAKPNALRITFHIYSRRVLRVQFYVRVVVEPHDVWRTKQV